MRKTYLCPVCGYLLEYPPSDFNICPSCGTEFGYSDSGRSYEELRENWFLHGAKWSSSVQVRPVGWDAMLQVARPMENPTITHDTNVNVRWAIPTPQYSMKLST